MRHGNNASDDSMYNGRGLAKRDNMEAFDLLPKAVRQALANSDHNWSAAQLYFEHKRRKRPECRTAAACVAFLTDQDKRKHEADADRGLVCGGQR